MFVVRWLRHVWWVLTKGYTCDDCGRWTRRWRGRAKVVWRRKSVPVGRRGGRAPGSFLTLLCPACDRKRAAVREVVVDVHA
jgi:hypothetical protein